MISGINHITLSSKNIEESFLFYKETLGFKPLLKWERGAYFLAGDLWFCVSLDKNHSLSKGRGHVAFSANREFISKVKDMVSSKALEEWTSNTSEGDSVYILDPSGNQLELHCGSWKTRLQSIKKQPYDGAVEFY